MFLIVAYLHSVHKIEESGYFQSMHKYLNINGEKIAYFDIGDGPILVCIHGWAMNAEQFKGLVNEQFRVIAIDLAGHGQSLKAKGPYSIERAADDLFAILEQLNLTDIYGLGWSMGAHIWWEMIAKYGESHLAGLIVEDMSPKVYNDSNWKLGTLNGRTIAGIDAMLADMQTDWTTFTYRFIPRIFANQRGDYWAELAEKLVRVSLKNQTSIVCQYWQSMSKKDYRKLLPTIKTNTLVAHGELSQLYGPEVAEYLCQQIPNSKAVNFPDSGHAPHLEEPIHFIQVLINFMSETNLNLSKNKFQQNLIPNTL